MSITPFPSQGQYPWYDQLEQWGADTQAAAENATIAADQVHADVAGAVADAQAAQVAATNAAGLVGAPADEVVATLVGNPETLSGTAITGVVDPLVSAVAVQRRPRKPVLDFQEHTGLLRQPLSVDSDGYMYVSRTDGSNQLQRTNDGLATVETMTASFSTLGDSKTLRRAFKTSSGYVAYTSGTTSSDEGTVWFSSNFSTGWTRVLETKHILSISIGQPKTALGGTNTILTLGEYGNGDSRRVFLSEDGGETWRVIYTHTRQPGGTSNNTHVHHCAYDEHTGRLWLSCGDGVNNFFGYSDDLGETWVPVPAAGAGPEDVGTIFNHPTVVAPTSFGIVTTPDGASGGQGVWMINKDTGRVTIAHEVAQTEPYRAWSRAPWAQSGDELYIMFPPDEVAGEVEEIIIAGTGDGGRSWHTMFRLPISKTADLFFTGIVGPDAQGRLWMLGKRSGVNKLYVANTPKWDDVALGSVLETNRGSGVLSIAPTLTTVANSTVATALGTVTAPPNLTQNGDIVRVTIFGQSLNNSGNTADTIFKLRLRNLEVLSTGNVSLASDVAPRNWKMVAELHVIGTTYSLITADFAISKASSVSLPTGDAISGVAVKAIAEGSTTILPVTLTATHTVANPEITTTPMRMVMELIRNS